MNSIQEQFAELTALTQLYLMREFSQNQWIVADPEAYTYFKQHLAATAVPPIQRTPPKQTVPPPPAASQSKQQANVKVQEKIQPAPPPSIPQLVAAKETIPTPVNKTPPPTPTPPTSPTPKTTPTKSRVPMPESLQPISEVDLSDFKKIMKEKFPALVILDHVPGDEEAKRINSAWKQDLIPPAVLILCADENPKHRAFLFNLAKAISVCQMPAQVVFARKIEQENGWNALLKSNSLQLVIACDSSIHGLPGLMNHYREAVKQAKHYLGQVPLYLLSDLSIYWKEPRLKATLWNALRSELKG